MSVCVGVWGCATDSVLALAQYETMQDALAMAADTVALMKAREGGGGGGAASPADSDVDAILEALSSVSGREGGPTPST